MIPAFARTFEQYVSWMARNTPHTAVLMSWARVEGALQEYATAFDMPSPAYARARFDEIVRAPNHLGPDHADTIRQLRDLRDNVVRHQVKVTTDESREYLGRSLDLLTVIYQNIQNLAVEFAEKNRQPAEGVTRPN
jgi:hypothetical protein